MDFNGNGQNAWSRLTGKAACSAPGDPTRRVAIVLDKDIISAPQVDPEAVPRALNTAVILLNAAALALGGTRRSRSSSPS